MKTQFRYANLKRITYTLDRQEIFDILKDYVISIVKTPGGEWLMDVDEDELGLLQIQLFQDFKTVTEEHDDNIGTI